jgi:hypothetical protein
MENSIVAGLRRKLSAFGWASVLAVLVACARGDGDKSTGTSAAAGSPAADSATSAVGRPTSDGRGAQPRPLVITGHDAFESLSQHSFAEYIARASRRDPEGVAHLKIPEYNDQQKLLDGTMASYGPVATIWAAPDLSSYTSPIDFRAANGQLVALIDVRDATSNDSYAALHIESGKGGYCVRLRSTPNGTKYDWNAFILPAVGTDCPDLQDVGAATPLAVDYQRPSPNAQDYVAVARWGSGKVTGEDDNRPIILVDCGNAVCGILPAGVKKASQIHPPTGNPQTDVDLWYDEQWVSVVRGNKWVRKHRASAVPVPGLGSITDPDKFQNGLRVARIYFKGQPDQNDPEDKYAQVGFVHGWNDLWIRGTAAQTTPWEYRIGANGKWKASVTPRHVSGGAPIPPPTARWRWSAGDEDLWVRCAQGCCDVDF